MPLQAEVTFCTAGHYFLRSKAGNRIPVLHSTVGYTGIPDGGDPRGTQSLWAWSPGTDLSLQTH